MSPGNKGLCGGSGSGFYDAANLTAISLPPCKGVNIGAIVGNCNSRSMHISYEALCHSGCNVPGHAAATFLDSIAA